MTMKFISPNDIVLPRSAIWRAKPWLKCAEFIFEPFPCTRSTRQGLQMSYQKVGAQRTLRGTDVWSTVTMTVPRYGWCETRVFHFAQKCINQHSLAFRSYHFWLDLRRPPKKLHNNAKCFFSFRWPYHRDGLWVGAPKHRHSLHSRRPFYVVSHFAARPPPTITYWEGAHLPVSENFLILREL